MTNLEEEEALERMFVLIFDNLQNVNIYQKMNSKEENICRICFTTVETECEVIDIIIREMLDVLWLRLDIDVSKDPVACKMCTKIIEKCYTFKVDCLDVEACTTDCDNKDEQSAIEAAEKTEDDFKRDLNRCRICNKRINILNCITMSVFLDELQFSELLPVYFPQKDFSANSIICSSCKENVESYLNFAHDSLTREEQINEYRQYFRPTDKLKLSDLQSFLHSYSVDLQNSSQLNHMREESSLSEIDFVNCNVKHEDGANIKQEKSNVMEKLGKKVSGTKPKKKFKCPTCKYVTDRSNHLRRHQEIHSADSERKRFYCTICPFSAVAKQTLGRHMTTHDDHHEPTIYKCTHCIFETKYKKSIQQHMIFVHKSETDLEIIKCKFCTYETARKDTFKRHMIMHKSRDEVQTFKCDVCTYETIHRSYFKTHKLTHGDQSGAKKYKCESCSYESKTKKVFDNHMLTHTASGAAYSCDKCDYKTMIKGYLKGHLLSHKDPSRGEMHKCPLCPFEAKYKNSVKVHMLNHDESLEPLKCFHCLYETIRKCNLVKHMIKHRDLSRAEIYKCVNCEYTTKYKADIKRHQIKHKEESEVKRFKCSVCDYQTKWTSNMTKHISKHVDYAEKPEIP